MCRVTECDIDVVVPGKLKVPLWLYSQAFMFETCLGLAVTEWGETSCEKLDHAYYKCWQSLKKHFNPNAKPQ